MWTSSARGGTDHRSLWSVIRALLATRTTKTTNGDGLCHSIPSSRRHQRGGALLTVLWLSAALAAIAFSLSTTVRGEADRAGTSLGGLRAYYLASGAIQRCSMELLWSVMAPE